MNECFKLQGNRDIEPCVPFMLSCIARPAEANNAITKLSATTFVQVRVFNNLIKDDLIKALCMYIDKYVHAPKHVRP